MSDPYKVAALIPQVEQRAIALELFKIVAAANPGSANLELLRRTRKLLEQFLEEFTK